MCTQGKDSQWDTFLDRDILTCFRRNHGYTALRNQNRGSHTRKKDVFKVLLTELKLVIGVKISALTVWAVCASVGTVFKAWAVFNTFKMIFVARD